MIVVMIAIATAAVLGYALLSGAATRSQIGQNDSRAAIAEAMAESGIELAKYYLLNPSAAPASTLVNGVYAGQTAVSFGEGVGTIESIYVLNKGSGVYQIVAQGLAGGVRRVLTEEVTPQPPTGDYADSWSIVSASSIYLPVNVTIERGPIRVDGTLTMQSGAPDVTLYATAGPVGSTIKAITSSVGAAPTYDALQMLKTSVPSYSYNGTTYNAKFFSGLLITTAMKNPTSDNPLNVWYSTNDVRISGGITMNGTIIVNPTTSATKKLIVSSGDNTIKAVNSGALPALIVRDNIEFSALGVKLKTEGSVWLGGSITATSTVTGTSSNPVDLDIKGELMLNAGRDGVTNTIVSSPQVRVKINNDQPASTVLRNFAIAPGAIGGLTLNGFSTLLNTNLISTNLPTPTAAASLLPSTVTSLVNSLLGL